MKRILFLCIIISSLAQAQLRPLWRDSLGYVVIDPFKRFLMPAGVVVPSGTSLDSTRLAYTDKANTFTLNQTGKFLDKGGTVYNVKAYGAVGDSVTNDSAAIAATITAIPSAGGVLYFPSGKYNAGNGGFVISKNMTIAGDGMSSSPYTSYLSRIDCNSNSGDLFKVTAMRVTFRNLSLKNTSLTTPISGSGIRDTSSNGLMKVDYENIRVEGFYTNINIQVGALWVANNIHLADAVLNDISIQNLVNQDQGDWCISNSFFYVGPINTTPNSAIYIAGSGGGKIANCKILGAFVYGVDMESAVTTSQLSIFNANIEQYTNSGINVNVTAGLWKYFTFSGNVIGANQGTPIKLTSYSLGSLLGVAINGCTFFGGSGLTGISLTNISTVTIAGCTYVSGNRLYSSSGCSNITVLSDTISTPSTGVLSGNWQINGNLQVQNNVTADSSNFNGRTQTQSLYVGQHGAVALNGTTKYVESPSYLYTQPADTEKVLNGGFETNVARWTRISGFAPTRVTTFPVLAGTASINFVQSGSNGGGVVADTTTGVNVFEPSTTYLVSFLFRWRVVGTNTRIRFSQCISSSGGSSTNIVEAIVATDTSITYFVHVIYTTVSTANRNGLLISGEGNSGTFRVDNVCVEKLQPFTIMSWFKTTATNWVPLINRKLNDSTSSKGWSLSVRDSLTGLPTFTVSDSVTQYKVSRVSNYNDGAWHLLTARVHPASTATGLSSTTISINIDNKDSLTTSVSSLPFLGVPDSILIGRYGNNYGNITVGATQIIKYTQPTSAQIKSYYVAGLPLTSSGNTISFWQWKAATFLNDDIANNNLTGRSVTSSDRVVGTYPSLLVEVNGMDSLGQLTTAKIINVAGIATEGLGGVPIVVDTVEQSSAASIGTTNFNGTSTSGYYEVSGVVEVTAGSALGAVTVTLGFTNDNGAQTILPVSAFAATAAGQTYFSPIPIRTASGSISYATTLVGTPTVKLSLVARKIY